LHNAFPKLYIEKKGMEVRFVNLNKDSSLKPEVIEKLIDCSAPIAAVAAVLFNKGSSPNLSKISEIAHARNALFFADAAQGAGMASIAVVKDGIHIIAGCGFKRLLGMHGTGFLYVSNRVVKMIQPVLPGMYAAHINYDRLSYWQDAIKFETGTLAYSLFTAWSANLELLLSIGIDTVYKRY
jgi:cysteine desulfurase/selenocysteine lyase